jgi:hypothetical protein
MYVLVIFLVCCGLTCLGGAVGFFVVHIFTAEGPLLLTGSAIGGLSGLLLGARTLN